MAWDRISAEKIEAAVVTAAIHARIWDLNKHLIDDCYVSVGPMTSFAPRKPKISGIKVTIKPLTKAEVAKIKAKLPKKGKPA